MDGGGAVSCCTVLVHNVGLMPSRLILALALSLALHASLLLPEALQRNTPPAQPPLQATLRLPLKPAVANDEALLKNTLESAKAAVAARPPRTSGVAHSSQPTAVPKREVAAAQRKLSEHLYYPPEAVARGIEGEVRLILTVSADGQITDINIASSSGHAILDKAAVKAAWAMGKINWAHSREFILLVPFRLVD